MMNKLYLNTGGILGVILVVCVLYDALLHAKISLLSIDTMQTMMNRWVAHSHALAVGLLPVYVALVFFGAIISGLFLGSIMQRWLLRVWRRE